MARPTSMLFIAIFVVFESTAFGLVCPEAPIVVAKDVHVQTEAELAAIMKLKGLEFRNKTEVVAKNLLDKTPQSDRVYVVQLLSSMFCNLINESKTLSDKERLTEFREFQRRVEKLILPQEKTAPKTGAVAPPKSSAITVSFDQRRFLTLQQLRKQSLIPTYATERDNEYALVLHVTVRFAQPELNSDTALMRTVSDVSFASDGKLLEKRSLKVSQENVSAGASLRAFVPLIFASKPGATIKLEAYINSKEMPFTLGDVRWTRTSYESGSIKNALHIAQAEITILIDEPSWPFIRTAELLPAVDGAALVLKTVVENRSTAPLTLENLLLTASHPRVEEGRSCLSPDPEQKLVLNWDEVTSENENKSGSWTELGSSNVPVATRFSDAGKCSGFSFQALVPIARTVAANSVAQVIVKITNNPSEARVSSTPGLGILIPNPNISDVSGRMRMRPRDLREFKTLQLSLNATRNSQHVYPEFLTVSSQVVNIEKVLRNPSPTE